MTYTFTYYDGNTGNEIEFETFNEAMYAAVYKWDRLTRTERKAYTDCDKGGLFMVFDDNGDCVADFSELVE